MIFTTLGPYPGFLGRWVGKFGRTEGEGDRRCFISFFLGNINAKKPPKIVHIYDGMPFYNINISTYNCFRQRRRNNQCEKYNSKSNFPNWASNGNNFIAVHQELIALNREVQIRFSLVFPICKLIVKNIDVSTEACFFDLN